MKPNADAKPSTVLTQWLGVVAATLAVVLLSAFVSIPYTLGQLPGTPPQMAAADRHLT